MNLFNTAKNNSIQAETSKQPSILASLKSIITPKTPNLSAPKTPSLSAPKIPSLSAPKTQSLSPPKRQVEIPSISKSLSSFKSTIKKPSASYIEDIEDKISTPIASALNTSSNIVTSEKYSWKFWLGIIFLLALLGFNLFTYAADIIEFIKKLFAPMLSVFGYTVGETSKMTINTAAKGSTEIIDATADITTSGINILENALTNVSNSKTKNNSNTALESIEKNITSRPKATPIPDEANSRTQINKAIGKSGYCYVGEENNIRSCVKVSENDTCMSGDIFPSHDLCINPNLRK